VFKKRGVELFAITRQLLIDFENFFTVGNSNYYLQNKEKL